MAINLTEVGASCVVDVSGTLQITLGLYLPGIRSDDGFGVVVRIINCADRFNPSVAPVDSPMAWMVSSSLDLWVATVTLNPDPLSHYGQDGLYLYRFQLWWTPVGGAGQLITEWFSDPFARETDLGMSAVTCLHEQPAPFMWTDAAWRTPELDSLVVYEVQVQQFNGTFAGVEDRLAYLKSLGVNCIELMPVTSTKLDFDWDYGPLPHFAPHSAFGGSAGLKRLVDACHAQGIAVILDVLYEHVDYAFAYYRVYADLQSSPAAPKAQSPMIGSIGEFGPQIDFSKPFAQEYCQLANRIWLDTFHVDGFRYDQVTGFYHGPTDTAYAMIAYETYLHSRSIARFGCMPGTYSRLIQCAEALSSAPEVLQNTYTNAAWQNDLLTASQSVAAGDLSKATLTFLAHTLDPLFAGKYPSTKSVADSAGTPVDMPVAPFQYLCSHDHSHLITFARTISGEFPASGNRALFYRIQPLIVALYTCQGVPMLWEGEEFVDDYKLPPGGPARVNLRRDVHWEYFDDDKGRPVVRLYRILGALRATNPALRSRESYYYYNQSLVGNAILAYHRHAPATDEAAEQYAMVLINFGYLEGEIAVPFPKAGIWTESVDLEERVVLGEPPLAIEVANAGDFVLVRVPSNYGYVFLLTGEVGQLSDEDIDAWITDVEQEKNDSAITWPYLSAAAVLSSFDPIALMPFGKSAASKEAIGHLLKMSTPLVSRAGDGVRWQLKEGVRRDALRRLSKNSQLRAARDVNRMEAKGAEGDPLQQALDTLIDGHVLKTDEHNRLDDLLALQRACNWFVDIPGVSFINRPELTHKIELARLLNPMNKLVNNFVGRESELARLSDYVGVLAPAGVIAFIRRGVRHIRYLMSQRPPLFVNGPGGIGKSTLLSRFILLHREGTLDQTLPFIYLDFDRTNLDPLLPDTLVADAIRQIETQFPGHPNLGQSGETAREAIGAADMSDFGKSQHYELSERLVRRFVELLHAVSRINGQPVLFVLDTLEEVQVRGPTAVMLVWDLLTRLLEEVPGLRVVVSGRAPLPVSCPHEPLALPAFDTESAIAYLRRVTGPVPGGPLSESDAREIVGLVSIRLEGGGRGAVPLSLALAARIVVDQGLHALQQVVSRQSLYSRITAEQQQGMLNSRIMQHLHDTDPDFERIADPGLIVRRITVDVIQQVLADPCGLTLSDRQSAERLYNKLAQEAALIDTERESDALWHLASVRRVMLPALRRKVGRELEQRIHELAIAYYARESEIPGIVGETARAEEIYHRLCAGQPRQKIERRWRPGLETALRSAYDELEGTGKLWLAGKLGREVDDELRQQADLEQWERQAELRARALLQNGRAQEALQSLRERPHRTPASVLPNLEADALILSGRDDEARSVVLTALSRAASSGRDDVNSALLSRLSAIDERASRLVEALSAAREAARAAQAAGETVTEIGACAAIMRLYRKMNDEDNTESAYARLRIQFSLERREVRQQLRQRPAILGDVAAEIGLDDPDLLADALETLGVNREALGKLLEDLYAVLQRTTGSKGRLFDTVQRLVSRKAGVSTAGIGRELGRLVRRLRGDREFIQTIGRTIQTRGDSNVIQVRIEDPSSKRLQEAIGWHEIQQLAEELVRSTDQKSLEELVYLILDKPLAAITKSDVTLSQQAFDLVSYLRNTSELSGFLAGLVRASGISSSLRSAAAGLLRRIGAEPT